MWVEDDLITSFPAIIKNSEKSDLYFVSKKTQLIHEKQLKSRSAVRRSLCSNSLKWIAATFDTNLYKFYSFKTCFLCKMS